MEIFFQWETYIALLTLTVLEIILGIDNIIFISIITNKVERENRQTARVSGLLLAIVSKDTYVIWINMVYRAYKTLLFKL